MIERDWAPVVFREPHAGHLDVVRPPHYENAERGGQEKFFFLGGYVFYGFRHTRKWKSEGTYLRLYFK